MELNFWPFNVKREKDEKKRKKRLIIIGVGLGIGVVGIGTTIGLILGLSPSKGPNVTMSIDRVKGGWWAFRWGKRHR
jgi:hypothetical protein